MKTPIEKLARELLTRLHTENIISNEEYDCLSARIIDNLTKEKEQREELIKEKQLEALKHHIPRFMRWADEGANIEVDNSDFEAFKEIAENYIEEEILQRSN